MSDDINKLLGIGDWGLGIGDWGLGIEVAGSKSEEMTLSLLSSVWSQISIYALLAEVWQRPFRPAGIPKPQWIELIADEIAAGVFARLDRKAD